jgi:hypothetical protein
MKTIKVTLATVVVVIIGLFVIRSLVISPPAPEPPLPNNEFIKRIERKIDSLSQLPASRFCGNVYGEIKYLIKNYYTQRRLGKDALENKQQHENLSIKLYATYAAKFLEQTFFVFGHSQWKNEDLQFIRHEYQTLRNSSLLEANSPVDKKFREIQTVLEKYDEIAGFISDCRDFSYFASIFSHRFPIANVQDKISQATRYLNNHLDNSYVYRCTRLHDGLRGIPQVLFRTHVRYLDDKINSWSGLYDQYNSQLDYYNNLYMPLKKEIETLDNDIYNINNDIYTVDYERLLKRLEEDGRKAYDYFNKKSTN